MTLEPTRHEVPDSDDNSPPAPATATDQFLDSLSQDWAVLRTEEPLRPSPQIPGASVLPFRGSPPAPEPPADPPKREKVRSAARTRRPSVGATSESTAEAAAAEVIPAAWVTADVKRRLDAERLRTGLTITEIFVRAFNSQYASLDSWFPVVEPSAGPMPEAQVHHGPRQAVGPAVVLRLRLTAAQKSVLDTEVRARRTSRGALVTRVLDAALPQ